MTAFVPARAEYAGYEWNVQGQQTASDGTVIPGEIQIGEMLLTDPAAADPTIASNPHYAMSSWETVVVKVQREAAKMLRRALQEAGVRREALFADDAHRAPVTFHDLRATGITWCAVRGDEVLRLQQRAGHEDVAALKLGGVEVHGEAFPGAVGACRPVDPVMAVFPGWGRGWGWASAKSPPALSGRTRAVPSASADLGWAGHAQSRPTFA